MNQGQKAAPGKSGLMALDDTAIYLTNPFDYIQKHIAEHGLVFRTRLMMQDVVVLAGPEASQKFNDESAVRRAGALPPFIEKLFGGQCLPFLDGATHLSRKEQVLNAFTMEALGSYLPDMQTIVERHFSKWVGLGEMKMVAQLKDLAFEAICASLLGIRHGDALQQLQADYDAIVAGLFSLPIELPGFPYNRAVHAKERIFEVLAPLAAQRKETPGEDGLSRMLSGQASDGSHLTIQEAALEVHHTMIAGFVIFAELVALVRDLSRETAVRARLEEEVRDVPKGRLALEDLAKLHYLGQCVLETKRLCPTIPAQFGKAHCDFELQGYTIPAGTMILWALYATNLDPASYRDPLLYDPERFSPARSEHLRHPFAYVPQGGGDSKGHRCAGYDFATQLMEVFAISLLRDHRCSVRDHNAKHDWCLNPPQPVDAMLTTITAL